ncbi:hypothetical protein CAPTEDRAFT_151639 [Capitella teleta]|uniref:hydroxyacylglutathione hydrolase n=1 Tax=Capitella teleta TaxID=283909 RepID=R7TAS6_CAPTE|nr:hypothetical protein CAPTEDRAFT_151639 [Capitella teleta]|eukprot:ELT90617.1 hypothetical protein CAPTEDRAFT_151639 [Capitella teleta]
MRVRLVPALEDNYMYLLVDEATGICAAVDPVEPEKIVAAVKEERADLKAILTTHHHWDHANGNEALTKLVPGLTVYGGDDRIGALNHKVKHGDEFKIGSLSVRCLFTPCHTSGHICFLVNNTQTDDAPAVFTGDTLFVGGCGRFFEGTAQQMHTALNETLSKLHPTTKVYCGHEYTVSNLKFALSVEPENPAVVSKLQWAEAQRKNHQPTIPSTIGEEMQFNPFMRVSEKLIQDHVGASDVIEVMAAIRKEKDNFKPK